MPSEPSSPSGTRDCPDCGADAPPDANFCLHCGVELEDSSLPTYCPDCGERFDRSDEFCANCGTARTDSTEPATGSEPTRRSGSGRSSRSIGSKADERGAERSRSQPQPQPQSQSQSPPSDGPSDQNVDPHARRAFRRRVQRHLDAGWELEHDYDDRVVLVDRDMGSIAVHIVLLFLTGGIGNLLYGWYHYSELAERRHLSVDDRVGPERQRERESTASDLGTGTGTDPATPNFEALATASAYIVTATFLLIGSILLLSAVGGAGSIGTALFGLAFAASGLYVAPAFRRRLERRRGIGSVGRTRTVDHRVVHPGETTDERCVVCNDPFDGGVVRRRRDETVLAGFPIRTHELGYNYYCPACARRDLFAGSGDADLGPDLEVGDTESIDAELADTVERDGDDASGDEDSNSDIDDTTGSGASTPGTGDDALTDERS
ncbi:zinc ribbon domain-containing protein [Halobiforma nitratireducens]|uniref:Uncharacterized protein n=1 Tax=Halobiforma nitratireducens JCM 10879 TaxID=1227454 RepID=M0MG29_9EURY|nr:zinc ribbon domain-containing protein [Halobiforma nitratireducens]EMA44661.1 hypothetical protein C446_02887 [Halobiforma nitratireducens JCM 10879]